ncbi:NACHT domain-containing protein [Actinoplanes sp. NEAU-A11]|uniref:NACHT domain-containing protein n=1 Tax=Actinoplanes aureus TaxID=2792083 RepID=A0A931CDX9_9ACTN|nr:NACHT domain-containing protein [Actinoplanes aureus]
MVTPLFTRWLGGRRKERERTLPLSELLRERATDEFTRRRGERQIEAVVDDVAERLKPLITTRFAALPENEVVACMEAVADTFRRADLTDDAVFADDLEPARLTARLRASAPPAALSDLGERLYDIALDDCARCFVQFVVQTAPFTGRASVEILGRLSELTDLMSEALRRLALAVPETATGFLARYQEFLVKKLNALELVGLDTQFRPRTTLSVAYVSLAVNGTGAPARARLPKWDPGLLRHARLGAGGSERVEQALARRTRTLIRGDAGAGKSTLLRWLAVTAAGNGFTGALAEWNGRIPFLVKLRSWPAELPQPERFLSGVADPLVGAMPPGWVHDQLRAGRALLLVDGVDELPAERRPKVREWLRDLLAAYTDILVVITSRPPAAPVRWLEDEDFGSLTLERMAPADVRALIDQWHQAARTSPSLPCPAGDLHRYEQSLLNQLAANHHLYRLAGNPLMAAMLCALNLDRQTHLPPDRMGIYQAAVDMLLHRRDTEREVPSALPQMTARERLQLLQDLAWRLSLNGRSELTRAEALDYVSRKLAAMPRMTAEAEPVLQHLIERSGILREPAVGRIDFVHRTFQEYLTAREAAEQSMGGLLAGQAHLDTWREIVIMAAGHSNSPTRTEIVTGILARADREPRHRRSLTLLAGACLETVSSLEPSSLITEINARLDHVLPPRNLNEARSLYPVGDPLLRRLPADLAGLSEAQAAATVRTAALINGPHAIRVLSRYSQDPRRLVQLELAGAWDYFDAEEYAREVLAEAPLVGGHILIRRPSFLEATRHLRHLTTIDLWLRTSVDLRDLPANAKLTRLILGNGFRGPMAALERFRNLVILDAYDAHGRVAAADIGSLARLPELGHLSLTGEIGCGGPEISALSKLQTLKGLEIVLTEDIAHIDPLAALSRLESLDVEWGSVRSFRALAQLPVRIFGFGPCHKPPRRGLADVHTSFPLVEELKLYGSDHWRARLDSLRHFGRLRALLLGGLAKRQMPTLQLPTTARSIEMVFTDRAELAPLVNSPGLRRIDVEASDGPVDLTPFVDWQGGPLTIKLPWHKRKEQTLPDNLPASIKVRYA